MGVWSYDFVEAQTHDGRKLRLMTLIDEFTRCPPFWSVGKSHDPMPHRRGSPGSAYPICRRPCGEFWQVALQARPRSVDRTRSPIGVSQKQEYFKYQPETIGDFAPKLFKLGV